MEVMTFRLLKSVRHSGILTIKAVSKDEGYTMSVHIMDGKVLYPVAIESFVPGMSVSLDSDDHASCTVPPTIPSPMVPQIRDEMGIYEGIVAGAREFIREQLEREEKQNGG